MNKREFFSILTQALSALPEEERGNVLRYYEDYFLDAEGESEEELIAGLEDPHEIADNILQEYRELQPHHGTQNGSQKNQTLRSRYKGIPPWLLVILLLFAIPIGVPLLIAAVSVFAAFGAVILCVLLVIAIVVFVLPGTLLFSGVALVLFSFTLLSVPASGVMTFGIGLICLALGGLLAVLLGTLCKLFVPPFVRGIVAMLRWPIDKLREVLR